MADRSSALLIRALTRAAAEAGGTPLYSGKNSLGLFPSTALGKLAAQRCQEEGYLAATEPSNGRVPLCTITDKGMQYLLGQANPRQVLDDCVRILEEREKQLTQLVASVRQMQTGFEALRSTIHGVVSKFDAPSSDLKSLLADFRQDETAAGSPLIDDELLTILERRRSSGMQGDCPLPELFAQLSVAPSIGSFHDALRRLQSNGKIWLHPWTGPLYEIPQPPYALLVGHEVAYYVSLRQGEE